MSFEITQLGAKILAFVSIFEAIKDTFIIWYADRLRQVK